MLSVPSLVLHHDDQCTSLPGKEAKNSKRRVDGDVCLRVGLTVDLSAPTEAVQSVEHARAQKADKADHAQLCVRVVVNSLQARRALEHLPVGGMGASLARWRVICLFVDV